MHTTNRPTRPATSRRGHPRPIVSDIRAAQKPRRQDVLCPHGADRSVVVARRPATSSRPPVATLLATSEPSIAGFAACQDWGPPLAALATAGPTTRPASSLLTSATEDLVVPTLVLAELDYWCHTRLTGVRPPGSWQPVGETLDGGRGDQGRASDERGCRVSESRRHVVRLVNRYTAGHRVGLWSGGLRWVCERLFGPAVAACSRAGPPAPRRVARDAA